MQKFANSLDLVISTAPCDVNWLDYINTLKPKGKLCLVGVPQSEMAVPAFPLILGRKSVFGSPVGSPSRIREMLEFAARNHISPRTELFPLAQVNEALERVRTNRARYRIVLVN